MKTFSVQLFVEADDNDATEGFVEKIIENSFDTYDGYLPTNVSATLIDDTEEEEL